ncbi:MAG: vitamin B12 dependent methionine synthase, partial [Chloroflexota bacterium]
PKTATMNPGSGDVDVWPIEQQAGLFRLLGDGPERIGVRLGETFLMSPVKTVSGILFATEKDFRTCQVCRREGCPNRQAAFDQAMWEALR